MSRLPVPSSRSSTRPSGLKQPSTPSKASAPTPSPSPTPSQSRITSTLSPGVLRARTKSNVRPTAASPTPSRSRTPSTAPRPVATRPPVPKVKPQEPVTPSAPAVSALSIREAIALKRAEAKKGKVSPAISAEDEVPPTSEPEPEEDIYGRQSVRDTIRKARETGALNLTTRNLSCIPSILFQLHLNVTPQPLKSVPEEPPYGPDSRHDDVWYAGQDLKSIKMGVNEVKEVQPEISMFGSLKMLDMHKNKLISIPATVADLSWLTFLDLSDNNLTSIPAILFSLSERQ